MDMAMDLQYLYWLQGLREASANFFTPFMMWVSWLAVDAIIFVPAFVYWGIKKRSGQLLILSFGISQFMNGLIKLTVCAYRPWIRDARIVPAQGAIATAGGYSFPSGHTMDSSPIYGGLAVLTRKTDVLVAWICGVMILLTALSRNYIGVHTPQDVVVGTLLGLFAVFLASKVLNASESHPNSVLVCGLILCVLALLYITNKSYPMDYDASGKLIVDPADMVRHTFAGVGTVSGILIGMLLDRKYIHHEETGITATGMILSLIGFLICYYGNPVVKDFAKKMTGQNWGRFINQFVLMMFIFVVWPLVLKVCARKK